ncbi:unnamed protein product [Arctogadus glacialis]
MESICYVDWCPWLCSSSVYLVPCEYVVFFTALKEPVQQVLGHLGVQPDPGPSLRTSNSEVKAAVDFTPASAPPWRVVVSGSSLRAVISQLLTQVSPGSHPPVWWFTIFQEAHRLLRSSFPWVRVRVDRQQANRLLQPIAQHQVSIVEEDASHW